MRDDQFERLYAEHGQRLFGFLAYRTGDRALAEDLLAESFERALRGRRLFNPRKASEKTWLYAIAVNCMRDHGRRRAAQDRAFERADALVPAADHDAGLAAIELRDDVHRAMDVLSAEEREVIALRFGADLTGPEIAKVTSEKLTTVEGRLYRALRKMRDALGGGSS